MWIRVVVSTSLDGSLPSLIKRMVSVSQPRPRPNHHGNLQRVRALPLGKHWVEVVCHLDNHNKRVEQSAGPCESTTQEEENLSHLFFDRCRIHVGNLSDGELCSDLSRNDSLCARVREGSLNAMDGDGGVTPHMSQKIHLERPHGERSHLIIINLNWSHLIKARSLTLLLYMSSLTPILFL